MLLLLSGVELFCYLLFDAGFCRGTSSDCGGGVSGGAAVIAIAGVGGGVGGGAGDGGDGGEDRELSLFSFVLR